MNWLFKCFRSTSKQLNRDKASLSPSLGSASVGRSLSPHRGGWPEACSPRSTGSQEPRDPRAPYSTRDAPSSPGHTTPSTATTRVKGQSGAIRNRCLSSAKFCHEAVCHAESDQVASHHIRHEGRITGN